MIYINALREGLSNFEIIKKRKQQYLNVFDDFALELQTELQILNPTIKIVHESSCIQIRLPNESEKGYKSLSLISYSENDDYEIVIYKLPAVGFSFAFRYTNKSMSELMSNLKLVLLSPNIIQTMIDFGIKFS